MFAHTLKQYTVILFMPATYANHTVKKAVLKK